MFYTFVLCSSGADVTFIFPEDAERKPIVKKLPGKREVTTSTAAPPECGGQVNV